MKKIFIFLFFLLTTMPAKAGFFDPDWDFHTVKTEHFTIHYHKEITPIVEEFMPLAEEVYTELTQKIGWKPKRRVHVVLVDRTDDSNGVATVIPDNYILLYLAPPDADSSLDNYHSYLKMLFEHEYTHILHIDQYHGYVTPFRFLMGRVVVPNGISPGWMREGMAVAIESSTGRGRANFSYTDMILRTAIFENKFLKLDQMAGFSLEWPGGNGAYLYGGKFWQWLGAKYGEEKMTQYMKKYSSSLWLFSLNNKAKKVYGKSFYTLWKEWKADLEAKYFPLREKLEKDGITPFNFVVDDQSKGRTKSDQYSSLTTSPNGGYAFYWESLNELSHIEIHSPGETKPVILKRIAAGSMSFSHDGKKLAFASLGRVEAYKYYSDVYVYNTEKKTVARVREKTQVSMRASDPDFSPKTNRYIVMVRTRLNTDDLYLYDLKEKKGKFLTKAKKFTQFSNPRFSPDGQSIAVSRRDDNGNRDIILYSISGKEIRKITSDTAVDNHPSFSPNGQYIYYSSDKTGIANIYRFNKKTGQTERITNVLTGAFQPEVSADGCTLYIRYYTALGFKIAKTNLGPCQAHTVSLNPSPIEGDGEKTKNGEKGEEGDDDKTKQKEVKKKTRSSNHFQVRSKKTKKETIALSHQRTIAPSLEFSPIPGSKKYSPVPEILIPRYIVPTIATLDDSFLFGLSTGSFDPLYRHSWYLGANYRTDADFLGASFQYNYARYKPLLFVGAIRYALNWGDLFGTGEDFFEQRNMAYAGISMGYRAHRVTFSYFFENRDNLSDIPAGYTLDNLDRYAGLQAIYTYAKYKFFPNSISRETGPYAKFTLDVTDSILGSAEANEQVVATADLRYYLEMPWSDHHVLALKASGGYAWGDEEFGGSFRFGGPFGEGTLGGHSSRLFPFRGLPGVTFAGDRALLFSGEYRFPIARINRGLGTWPVFLNTIHGTVFTDYGDSWARDGKDGRDFFEDFFWSVGAELKADVVLGYGLPLTLRTGYAVILHNVDQVEVLTDPLFGHSIKNGTFYLEFGTSF